MVRAKGELTMPLDKDRKRIIRHRMAKTGESYTTARARVIARKTRGAHSPRIDYAARAGMTADTMKAYWTDRFDALTSLLTAGAPGLRG